MQLIPLPGNNPSNYFWMKKLADNFEKYFSKIEDIKYQHRDDKDNIKVELEAEELTKKAEEIVGGYVILAKSAGILVALHAIKEEKIKPEKCVFLGLPKKFADEDIKYDINKSINGYSVKTVFIQQEKDFQLSYDDTKLFLKENKVQLSEEPFEIRGEGDHHYNNIEKYKWKIDKFFSMFINYKKLQGSLLIA